MSTHDDELATPYWAVADAQRSLGVVQLLRQAPATIQPLVRIIRDTAPRAALRTIGLQLASGMASAVALLATSHLLAELLAPGTAPARLSAAIPAILAVAAAYLVRGGLDTGVALAHTRIGPAVVRAAQERLCAAALGVDLAALDSAEFHDRLHRARDFGLPHLQQSSESIVALFGSVAAVIGASAALGVLHPLLVVVLLVGVLPSGWAVLRAAQLGHSNVARTITLNRRLWMIGDLISQRPSAAEIRANQAEPFVQAEYRELAAALCEQTTKVGIAQAHVKAAGRVLSGLGLAAAFVALGVMVRAEWVPLAVAGTAVVAIRSSTEALSNLLMAASQLLEHGMYIDDYSDFLQLAASQTQTDHGRPPIGPPCEIAIDDVSFRYPGSALDGEALSGVTLTIRAGQIIALVGENGSGKTTLAKLIAGLYRPTTGQIRWDGRDLAQLDRSQFAAQVMVMLQEPVRWPHDALTNVRIGRHERRDPHRDALQAAARRAQADAVVASLPHGWNTLLSKYFRHGRELSAGQWQRLAVARGLYRDAPLLIWDEPTAPLDAAAEHAVYQSLRRLAADRTVILITHRLASIQQVNRIFLLHQGRLAEQGSHEELLAAGGHYARLYNLQADPDRVPAERS